MANNLVTYSPAEVQKMVNDAFAQGMTQGKALAVKDIVITLPKVEQGTGKLLMTHIFKSSVKGCQKSTVQVNGKTMPAIKVYTSPTDYFKSPISELEFTQTMANAIKSGQCIATICPQVLAKQFPTEAKTALKQLKA